MKDIDIVTLVKLMVDTKDEKLHDLLMDELFLRLDLLKEGKDEKPKTYIKKN